MTISAPNQQRITRSTNGIKRRRDTILEDSIPSKKRKDSKNNSETEEDDFELSSAERPAVTIFQNERLPVDYSIPKLQERLLLHGAKQRYQLDHTYQVPSANGKDEVLVKVQYVGLNPIDWKAPDFGFGIPWLPYIAGREFVGQVVSAPPPSTSDKRSLRPGDIVFSASTDYRDRRKAAFQELTVAPTYNVCRIPAALGDKSKVAGVAVAYVAAVLAMGVSLGTNFTTNDEVMPSGPDLRGILKSVPSSQIPEDVREESLHSIAEHERPAKGDWICIWGGSSTTACIIAQLAKHLGLRVIKVVDVAKHGARLSEGPADLIVDSHDPERAVDIIRRVTDGKLRFGVDTVGKPTAELLRRTLRNGDVNFKSHLVGLTGLPKDPLAGVQNHTVPIKVHHDVPAVGEAMMIWLEKLLATGKLVPPAVEVLGGGLGAVNDGLDRMRRGEISGRRLAVGFN